MRILVTGLCTVHWGRLEYGNIGNYYIIEPFFEELHNTFPEADIVTTFQMTEQFCTKHNVSCLPMEIYYAWSDEDLDMALKELGIAELYHQTGFLADSTDYIDEVIKSDMVIDFSGDMWGDNAELVGKNRFLVALLKDRVAQLLNKKVFMLAGSQGPFNNPDTLALARTVFEDFDMVTIREPQAIKLLSNYGFGLKNVKEYACPSFLFNPAPDHEMLKIYEDEGIRCGDRPTVGFVLCGFNMTCGPYNKWPRDDEEYIEFALAVEYIINTIGARVVLLSHSNGFELPPNFKPITGRDYPIVKQLFDVVQKRGLIANPEDLRCIHNVYNPWQTKAIIRQFDMFVTGRLHASVGAISQSVPTVFIMHGHGPRSTKIIGFAGLAGVSENVALPKAEDMIAKIRYCWDNRDIVRSVLDERIPLIKESAKQGFRILGKCMNDE